MWLSGLFDGSKLERWPSALGDHYGVDGYWRGTVQPLPVFTKGLRPFRFTSTLSNISYLTTSI